MDDLHMNRSLGTKWFTFYTKVRPWFACLTMLGGISEFIRYNALYTQYWWLLVLLIATIVQAVLSIIVFMKSRRDYIEFVRFVKEALLFETIYLIYDLGVQQYIRSGYRLVNTLPTILIAFLITYFVWYRLNVKYFNKRIVSDNQADNTNEATNCTI